MMRKPCAALLLLLIATTPTHVARACTKPVLLFSVTLGENSWEADIAFLDELANRLWADGTLKASIILYNPRRYRRQELPLRTKHLGAYIWREKGLAQDRVDLRFGGFRETAVMEIWLLAPNSCPAAATPTVPSREAVLVPGRFVYAPV